MLIIIFVLYASYKIHLKMIDNSWSFFLISSIFYFVGTYLFFESINYLHSYLRLRQIYIEFGHGSILLIETMLICFAIELINISIVIVRRVFKSKKNYESNIRI